MDAFTLSLALFVGFLWGLSPIMHKYFLNHVSYKLILTLGSLTYFMCTILFAIYYWKDLIKESAKLTITSTSMIVLVSVVTAFMANIIYFYVLKSTKSYIVSALVYSSPLFTLLLSYMFMNERITLLSGMGCVVVFVGVLMISMA